MRWERSTDGQGLVYVGTLGHVMLEGARFSIADTGRILSILAGYCFISGHVMIIGTVSPLATFSEMSVQYQAIRGELQKAAKARESRADRDAYLALRKAGIDARQDVIAR